jgi:hypothetical protein
MAHEYQVEENISPGRGRRKRNLRNELRGTEVLEAIMTGAVVAVTVALFLGGTVTG